MLLGHCLRIRFIFTLALCIALLIHKFGSAEQQALH